jgi:hypothetical protein
MQAQPRRQNKTQEVKNLHGNKRKGLGVSDASPLSALLGIYEVNRKQKEKG